MLTRFKWLSKLFFKQPISITDVAEQYFMEPVQDASLLEEIICLKHNTLIKIDICKELGLSEGLLKALKEELRGLKAFEAEQRELTKKPTGEE